MTTPIPPDLVTITIDYLAEHADVNAITSDVSGELPNPIPDAHLRVVRIDGAYRDKTAWVDGALLDIEARARDADTAELLARTARAALMQIVGYQHDEGVIVNVAGAGGPHDLPDTDEEPPMPRHVFTINLEAHPHP